LPKLHNWVYHVVDLIEEFGAINCFTTETYEFLHKDYVKNPYRVSNKREAMGQIINTVCVIVFLHFKLYGYFNISYFIGST
jgi:hypothetical protein